MYYEVYIDVLFLINFCMDFFVLEVVRKILRCTATHRRILAGSVIGAISITLLFCLPVSYIWKTVIAHGALNICMLKIALNLKDIKSMLKAMILLYTISFFLGGFLEWALVLPFFLENGKRTALMILVLSCISYAAIQGALWIFRNISNQSQYIFPVEISLNQKTIKVVGLMDTGNSLKEPISGKLVSILERECAVELMEAVDERNFRIIPFRSLGKEHGIMQGFQAEKMVIKHERQELIVKEPMIGVYNGKISAKAEYQVIIHPMLIN